MSTPLPKDQISEDPEICEVYGRDWVKKFKPQAKGVLFPKSHEEVVKCVEWARAQSLAIVPSGGRTGLSGGATALKGEWILSLERMNRVIEVNSIDLSFHCEAGLITERAQEIANEAGLYFPIDFASRGSSQVGGNVATNAGGTKVIRYGMMRPWVRGLKAVLGNGETLDTTRALLKDNSGYDLKQLLIGSEGTLGIITEIVFGLTAKPRTSQVFLLAARELKDSTTILTRFRESVSLTAFEYFSERALQFVLKHTDLARPFADAHPFYFVIEFEQNSSEDLDRALDVFESLQKDGIISDGVMSQSTQQALDFWRYREDVSEALAHAKPFKSDISVRISEMSRFVEAANERFAHRFPETELVWFGHIGDGNHHINVIPKEGSSLSRFQPQFEAFAEELAALVKEFRGSISAEHGIGITKKPYLSSTLSLTEVQLMKSLKSVFDPKGILNPGKVFD